jgi:hypothetical protein
MRSQAFIVALFIALAAPTSAFAATRQTTPSAQVSPAGEHLLSRTAADARFARREAKARDLDRFEGGRVYYVEDGGAYIAISMTTLLLVVLVLLLV